VVGCRGTISLVGRCYVLLHSCLRLQSADVALLLCVAAGPAKSRRDDLLTKRDGLRQQQLAAEGQLGEQLK
jgi:hypothetical protein